jgi:hypothetical protein
VLIPDFSCGASLFGKAAKFRRVVRRARVDCARSHGRDRGSLDREGLFGQR